jgi:hypothetical protein
VIQIKVFLWYFSLRFPTSSVIIPSHSGSIFYKLFHYCYLKTKKGLKINDWPKILVYNVTLLVFTLKWDRKSYNLIPSVFISSGVKG